MPEFKPGKSVLFLVCVIFWLLSGACSKQQRIVLPVQTWGDATVRIEILPSPTNKDVHEFIVLISKGHKPVANVMVSLRTTDDAPWKQAIQDGNVGVYRTVLTVSPGSTQILVLLRQGSQESLLKFPLG